MIHDINMIHKNSGYEQILVGDLYHWELDSDGYFVVEENSSNTKHNDATGMDFETLDLDKISEDIQDE